MKAELCQLSYETWYCLVYARRDSDPHYRRPQRRASCQLGYGRVRLVRFELTLMDEFGQTRFPAGG